MKKDKTIVAILLVICFILCLNGCFNTDSPISDIKSETKIEHIRDTIYVPTYITIKEDKSIVRIDENNQYKDSTFTYYNQTFKDSNYSLQTFGGYVDSIDLTFKCEDKYIYDSTIITNTITKTNTVFKSFKHTLGIDYIYNMNNNVIIDYTRSYNRIGLSIGTGINIDNKSLLIKAGLKYSFN